VPGVPTVPEVKGSVLGKVVTHWAMDAPAMVMAVQVKRERSMGTERWIPTR
jgi:hypothetical protein